MRSTLLLLAAAASPDSDANYRSLFIWSAVLIAILLVFFGAYSYLTKWMKAGDVPQSVGFTLSDLRALHKAGKMSTEEFELARANMVASAKKMTADVPAIKPKSPAGDAEDDD